jgi:hypothetical protein
MNLGQITETFSQDKRDWLQGDHGTDIAVGVTLDVSTFTAGTHYPDGYIKSGIPLGKITASGKYGLYDDTKTDGRQTLVGFLFTGVEVVTRRGATLSAPSARCSSTARSGRPSSPSPSTPPARSISPPASSSSER